MGEQVLSGRVALVTGASRWIRAATAERVASEALAQIGVNDILVNDAAALVLGGAPPNTRPGRIAYGPDRRDELGVAVSTVDVIGAAS